MVFQPTFFAPIIQYAALLKATEISFEKFDNFQKQTYRNRCYIYGANGRQLLSVPIKHTKTDGRQKTKDVQIDHSFNWQRNMVRSLEASYRSSPFFEYYEDEIMAVFEGKQKYLLDLNLLTIEVINNCLDIELSSSFSTDYLDSYPGGQDRRNLANAKSKVDFRLEPYTQVFGSKHGFMDNLSILDLLFNEGTASVAYLERQELRFKA